MNTQVIFLVELDFDEIRLISTINHLERLAIPYLISSPQINRKLILSKTAIKSSLPFCDLIDRVNNNFKRLVIIIGTSENCLKLLIDPRVITLLYVVLAKGGFIASFSHITGDFLVHLKFMSRLIPQRYLELGTTSCTKFFEDLNILLNTD